MADKFNNPTAIDLSAEVPGLTPREKSQSGGVADKDTNFYTKYVFYPMSSFKEKGVVMPNAIYIDENTRGCRGCDLSGKTFHIFLPEHINLNNSSQRLKYFRLQRAILSYTSSEKGGRLTKEQRKEKLAAGMGLGDAVGDLTRLAENLQTLADQSGSVIATDEQLMLQMEAHLSFSEKWEGTTEKQMELIAEVGEFNLVEARDAAYLMRQKEKLDRIVSVLESEKRESKRKGAFEEFFNKISDYSGLTRSLVEDLRFLKGELNLTSLENAVFDRAIEAMIALQEQQQIFSDQVCPKQREDFFKRSGEEQIQSVLKGEESLTGLREKVLLTMKLLVYVDELFDLHNDEIAKHYDRFTAIKKIFKRTDPVILGTIFFQNYSRSKLLTDEIIKNLSALESEKLKSFSEKIGKIVDDYNELKEKNILLSGNHDNTNEVSRDGFLQDEGKADNFRIFLNGSREKIAYFNLLCKLHQKDSVNALKENEAEIKKNLPFIAKALDELNKEEQGKGYTLNLVEKIPGFVADKGVNLARNEADGTLAYAVRNREGKVVVGSIDTKVQGDLSLSNLNKIKKQILDEIAKQGYIMGEEEEKRQIKEKILLASNTIKALLLDILEPDFADFTKRAENRIPQQNLDFELEEEIVVIPHESHSIVASHLSKPRLARTTSLEKLSAMLGEAVEAVTTKTNSLADSIKDRFRAEVNVPFSEFSHFVQKQVEVFNSVGKEQNDARLKGWEFIYRRDETALEKTPTDFKVNDTVLVKHDGAPVFTVSPTRIEEISKDNVVANGVSVVVHRHEKDDMALAVRIMVEAMARTGEKKICISVTDSTIEAKKLILDYANVILLQGAIPVLTDKEGSALSTKRTKLKLKEIEIEVSADELTQKKSKISEHYSAKVKHIRLRKKEDASLLEKFDLAMKQPVSISTAPEVRKDEALRNADFLTRIMLDNRNLTEDDFVNRLITCVRHISPEAQELSNEKIHELKSKNLFKLRSLTLKQKEGNVPFEDVSGVLFGFTELHLKDYAFLQNFDSCVRDLKPLDVVARLQHVFSRDNLNQKEFIKKIVAYAQIISSDKNGSFTPTQLEAIEKELKTYFDESVAKNSGVPSADLAVQLYNLAAKALGSTNPIVVTGAAQTGELPLQVELVSERKLQPVPVIQESNPEFSSEEQDALLAATDDLLKDIETPVENAVSTMQDIQTLDVHVYDAPVYEASPKMHVQEIIELKESELSLAQNEFEQRITALYDQRKEIGLNRQFARALAAYALFSGEIRHENSDLAESMIPDISFMMESAEKLFKTDAPKSSSAERKDAAKNYEKLLQKASNELKLELRQGNAAFDSKMQEGSLQSFSEQILAQDLEAQQLLKEILEEAEKTSSEDPFSEDAFELESYHSPNLQDPKVSDIPSSESENLEDLIKILDDEIALLYSDKLDAETKQHVPAPTHFSFFGNPYPGAKDKPKTILPPVSHPVETAQRGFSPCLGIFGNSCAGAVNNPKAEPITIRPGLSVKV